MVIVFSVSLLVIVLFSAIRIMKKINQQKQERALFSNIVAPVAERFLPGKEEFIASLPGDAATLPGEAWWSRLPVIKQVNLATALCRLMLPVWDNYTRGQDIRYGVSSTTSPKKISHGLLSDSINKIEDVAEQNFQAADGRILKESYNNFIEAVLAIQDAVWVPPYPVKKLFLSVYNILKSLVEQHNPVAAGMLLTEVISHMIDCLHITKLQSQQEIDLCLDRYQVI